MNVVHIIKIVLTAGAERHLLQLLPALAGHDIQPHLIVLVEPDTPMDDFIALATARNISVERLTIRHHADITLLPRLVARLRALQPDIVHTHLLHADLYGTLAARLTGTPVVISRHNDNAFRYKRPMRWLNRALWSQAAAGITISAALERFCLNVEGAEPNKIATIHYGLAQSQLTQSDNPQHRQTLLSNLNLPPDAFLFGTVSRLIEQKGLPFAINAFHQIYHDYAKSYLLITGDGNQRHQLEKQAADLGLSDRVRFLGWRDDARRIMAALDVFLLPSLWEGFGLVLLEAMSKQRPIIATDVSAIPEIVQHNKTGLIVPPRDADALAAAMRRLLDDPDLRQQMGRAGFQRLQTTFTEQKMVERTTALYHQVLSM